MLDLEPIKTRLAAATPAPWMPVEATYVGGVRGWSVHIEDGILPPTQANAELVAYAPIDLEALVAEVERLRDGALATVAYLRQRCNCGVFVACCKCRAWRDLRDAINGPPASTRAKTEVSDA